VLRGPSMPTSACPSETRSARDVRTLITGASVSAEVAGDRDSDSQDHSQHPGHVSPLFLPLAPDGARPALKLFGVLRRHPC
jgi:hypothetical protein